MGYLGGARIGIAHDCGEYSIRGVFYPVAGSPDIAVILGDGIDGHYASVRELLTKQMQASGISTASVRISLPHDSRASTGVICCEDLEQALEELEDWLEELQPISRIGYFSGGVLSAACLIAAAHRPNRIKVLACCDARPDLAGEHLLAVRSPTLLLTGGLNDLLIFYNKGAAHLLNCEKKLVLVPSERSLTRNAKVLEIAAEQAAAWLTHHLSGEPDPSLAWRQVAGF